MGWVCGRRAWWCFVALLCSILGPLPAKASDDPIQDTLKTRPLPDVVEDRLQCAGGFTGRASHLLDEAFASNETAFLADECIANLVRLGREKQLSVLNNTNGQLPNSPLGFDTGFVVAYRKAEQPPANLPTVTVLRPIAARCFEETEQDGQLCYSVGYAYGLRAAQGEQVVGF